MHGSLGITYAYGIADWGLPEVVRGPGTHILACKRYPVAKLMHLIPIKYIEALEQNQKIASCCRHPENHDISAWYSCEEDRKKGIPDIYIFHCPCGRDHRRFCVGGSNDPKTGKKTHPRPFWDVH
jgi:hypothetical protein